METLFTSHLAVRSGVTVAIPRTPTKSCSLGQGSGHRALLMRETYRGTYRETYRETYSPIALA